MILYTYRDLTIRTLADEDAALLEKWLNDPYVLEYYEGRDRPHDMAMVHKHFYERTFEITQCIVQYKGRDIGYIQFYPIDDDERTDYGYQDFAGKIFGMDQFIGDTEHWNQGIGTELVTSMVNYLLLHERADKIVLDPQTWNTRAIRVYEKCGFQKVLLLPKREWHEGEYKDCWLMEYHL